MIFLLQILVFEGEIKMLQMASEAVIHCDIHFQGA